MVASGISRKWWLPDGPARWLGRAPQRASPRLDRIEQ
jgi:hypothetical protein